VRAPSQRRALGVLFALLTAMFLLIAVAALEAGQWIVGVAAGALALWVGSLALRSFAAR
jgi:succinate-acetate transporter protein